MALLHVQMGKGRGFLAATMCAVFAASQVMVIPAGAQSSAASTAPAAAPASTGAVPFGSGGQGHGQAPPVVPVQTQSALSQAASPVQSLPATLLNMDLASTVRSVIAPGMSSLVINVGGRPMMIMAGQELTPAQQMAAYQVAGSGTQALIVNSAGRATGGSFNISSDFANSVSSLTIPANVKAIYNAAGSPFSLLGDLVNAGQIYGYSQNSNYNTASISAANITNLTTGVITTVAQDRSHISNLSLSLSAANNFTNYGLVESAGSLSIRAGGQITNGSISAPGVQAVLTAVNDISLLSTAGAINNAGLITSSSGSINLLAGTDANLVVNNMGGQLRALSGAINVRADGYSGSANSLVTGGDLLSESVNLYTGNGITDINVGLLTGTLSSYGNAAHVTASTNLLVLGEQCLTGDPTYYNAGGDIELNGDIAVSETLTIVASGNITATSGLTQIAAVDGNGQGYDVTLIAGANIDASNAIGTSPADNPPFLDATQFTAGTISVSAGSGGNIDLSAAAGLGINASSVGAGMNGGSITLAAFDGFVQLSNDSSINSSGTAAGGKVAVIAGTPGGNAIQIGSINTNGNAGASGAVALITTQPKFTDGATSASFAANGTYATGSATVDTNSGSYTASGTGAVTIAGTVDTSGGTDAGNIDIKAGGSITAQDLVATGANGGNVTVSGDGGITVNGSVDGAVIRLSTNGVAAAIGNNGSVGSSNTTSLALNNSGGDLSVAGSGSWTTGAGAGVTLSAKGNIDLNDTLGTLTGSAVDLSGGSNLAVIAGGDIVGTDMNVQTGGGDIAVIAGANYQQTVGTSITTVVTDPSGTGAGGNINLTHVSLDSSSLTGNGGKVTLAAFDPNVTSGAHGTITLGSNGNGDSSIITTGDTTGGDVTVVGGAAFTPRTISGQRTVILGSVTTDSSPEPTSGTVTVAAATPTLPASGLVFNDAATSGSVGAGTGQYGSITATGSVSTHALVLTTGGGDIGAYEGPGTPVIINGDPTLNVIASPINTNASVITANTGGVDGHVFIEDSNPGGVVLTGINQAGRGFYDFYVNAVGDISTGVASSVYAQDVVLVSQTGNVGTSEVPIQLSGPYSNLTANAQNGSVYVQSPGVVNIQPPMAQPLWSNVNRAGTIFSINANGSITNTSYSRSTASASIDAPTVLLYSEIGTIGNPDAAIGTNASNLSVSTGTGGLGAYISNTNATGVTITTPSAVNGNLVLTAVGTNGITTGSDIIVNNGVLSLSAPAIDSSAHALISRAGNSHALSGIILNSPGSITAGALTAGGIATGANGGNIIITSPTGVTTGAIDASSVSGSGGSVVIVSGRSGNNASILVNGGINTSGAISGGLVELVNSADQTDSANLTVAGPITTDATGANGVAGPVALVASGGISTGNISAQAVNPSSISALGGGLFVSSGSTAAGGITIGTVNTSVGTSSTANKAGNIIVLSPIGATPSLGAFSQTGGTPGSYVLFQSGDDSDVLPANVIATTTTINLQPGGYHSVQGTSGSPIDLSINTGGDTQMVIPINIGGVDGTGASLYLNSVTQPNASDNLNLVLGGHLTATGPLSTTVHTGNVGIFSFGNINATGSLNLAATGNILLATQGTAGIRGNNTVGTPVTLRAGENVVVVGTIDTSIGFGAPLGGTQNAGDVNIAAGKNIFTGTIDAQRRSTGSSTGIPGAITLSAGESISTYALRNANGGQATGRVFPSRQGAPISVSAGSSLTAGQVYGGINSNVLLNAGTSVTLGGINFPGSLDPSLGVPPNSLYTIEVNAGTSITNGYIWAGAAGPATAGSVSMNAGTFISNNYILTAGGTNGNGGALSLTAGGDITTDVIYDAFSDTRAAAPIYINAGGDVWTAAIQNFGSGAGANGGSVDIRAGGSVDAGDIATAHFGATTGDAGSVSIFANGSIAAGNILAAQFGGGGSAGNVTLVSTTGGVVVSQGIDASSTGTADVTGGSVSVVAAGPISVNGIFTNTATTAGNAASGNIFISSGSAGNNSVGTLDASSVIGGTEGQVFLGANVAGTNGLSATSSAVNGPITFNLYNPAGSLASGNPYLFFQASSPVPSTITVQYSALPDSVNIAPGVYSSIGSSASPASITFDAGNDPRTLLPLVSAGDTFLSNVSNQVNDLIVVSGGQIRLSGNLDAGTGNVVLAAAGTAGISQDAAAAVTFTDTNTSLSAVGGDIVLGTITNPIALPFVSAATVNAGKVDLRLLGDTVLGRSAGGMANGGLFKLTTDGDLIVASVVSANSIDLGTTGAGNDLTQNNSIVGLSHVKLSTAGLYTLATAVSVSSASAPVDIIASDISVTGSVLPSIPNPSIFAGVSTVTLAPAGGFQIIELGSTSTPGGFHVTDAVLGVISANTVTINGANNGLLTVTGNVDVSGVGPGAFNLDLVSGGSILSDGGTIAGGLLSASALTGSVSLDTSVYEVRATAGVDITINQATDLRLGSCAANNITVSLNDGVVLTTAGDTVAASTLTVNASDVNNFGHTLAANVILLSTPNLTGDITISGTDGVWTAAAFTNIYRPAGNTVGALVFAPWTTQTFNGATNVLVDGASVVVGDEAHITGTATVTLDAQSLILGSGATLIGNPLVFRGTNGAGTIAAQGTLTLPSNLTYVGQDLAIIATGDIIAGTKVTSINLSNSKGSGGSLTIVAGFDFTPATTTGLTPVSSTFSITGPSTTGGAVYLANTNINTSSTLGTLTSGVAPHGGNVTVVASAGSDSAGTIALGTVNTSANTKVGIGGAVNLIGQGGVQTKAITTKGATAGSVDILGAAPTIDGAPDVTIINGSLAASAGRFAGLPSDPLNGAAILVNGAITATGAVGSGGSVFLSADSQIVVNGAISTTGLQAPFGSTQAGGNVQISSLNSIVKTGAITTSAVASNSSSVGGDAGAILLTAASGVTTGALSAIGSANSGTGGGGNGGNISIATLTKTINGEAYALGNLLVTGKISTSGGAGGTKGGNGGNAGAIAIDVAALQVKGSIVGAGGLAKFAGATGGAGNTITIDTYAVQALPIALDLNSATASIAVQAGGVFDVGVSTYNGATAITGGTGASSISVPKGTQVTDGNAFSQSGITITAHGTGVSLNIDGSLTPVALLNGTKRTLVTPAEALALFQVSRDASQSTTGQIPLITNTKGVVVLGTAPGVATFNETDINGQTFTKFAIPSNITINMTGVRPSLTLPASTKLDGILSFGSATPGQIGYIDFATGTPNINQITGPLNGTVVLSTRGGALNIQPGGQITVGQLVINRPVSSALTLNLGANAGVSAASILMSNKNDVGLSLNVKGTSVAALPDIEFGQFLVPTLYQNDATALAANINLARTVTMNFSVSGPGAALLPVTVGGTLNAASITINGLSTKVGTASVVTPITIAANSNWNSAKSIAIKSTGSVSTGANVTLTAGVLQGVAGINGGLVPTFSDDFLINTKQIKSAGSIAITSGGTIDIGFNNIWSSNGGSITATSSSATGDIIIDDNGGLDPGTYLAMGGNVSFLTLGTISGGTNNFQAKGTVNTANGGIEFAAGTTKSTLAMAFATKPTPFNNTSLAVILSQYAAGVVRQTNLTNPVAFGSGSIARMSGGAINFDNTAGITFGGSNFETKSARPIAFISPAAPGGDAFVFEQDQQLDTGIVAGASMKARISGLRGSRVSMVKNALLLYEGELFVDADSAMTITAVHGDVELRKGALVHIDTRGGNLHVKACSNAGDVAVSVRGHKMSLQPGQEVILVNHVPSDSDLHQADGIGRRRQEIRQLSGGMHVVMSDFSVITVLGNLNAVRSSGTESNKRVIERMLKTAAALDVLTRSRGAYFAIPRETPSRRVEYGESSAQANHIRPVSFSR